MSINTIVAILKKYSRIDISITDNLKIYKDLNIYGDDFEDLISELSKKLNFNEVIFWQEFIKEGYYLLPEVGIFPKVFNLNVLEFFKVLISGKKKYHKMDISVKEFISLIEFAIKHGNP